MLRPSLLLSYMLFAYMPNDVYWCYIRLFVMPRWIWINTYYIGFYSIYLIYLLPTFCCHTDFLLFSIYALYPTTHPNITFTSTLTLQALSIIYTRSNATICCLTAFNSFRRVLPSGKPACRVLLVHSLSHSRFSMQNIPYNAPPTCTPVSHMPISINN